jgi:hypothetical protein
VRFAPRGADKYRVTEKERFRDEPHMIPLETMAFRQLEMIRKIIADETWLEGERRGCAVSEKDPVVRENVCRVVLRIGQQMRETVMREERLREAGQLVADASFDQHRTAA